MIPTERIERSILVLRHRKVMLDSDLAGLYGVETRVLIQAIRRNQDRFPEDFMFQLTQKELNALRSQSVISNVGRGGRRYRPYVFTEEGVAMLSTVLRSSQAIHVSIAIMQAFVKLRELLSTQKDLVKKLDNLEQKYDAQFKVIFDAIRQLMAPPVPKNKRRIGFRLI
ncbi:DNA-binding protein [Candidatus Peribacteria bacterium RIFCSPHIGHO2_12_FULL_55_11]|nr:MAG: DNA-binding protein [Candidatus Peribacteria bacterium RIFCSPHIGHO2_12_FULL_55_11]